MLTMSRSFRVTKNDRERRGFHFTEDLNQGLKLRPSHYDDAVIDAFCKATGMGEPEADGQIRVTKQLKFEVNGQTVHITTNAEEDDDATIPTKGPRLSRHGSEDSMIEMERGEGRFRRRGSQSQDSIGMSEDSIGKGKNWRTEHTAL